MSSMSPALPLEFVLRDEVGREAYSCFDSLVPAEHLVAICLPLSRMTQVAVEARAIAIAMFLIAARVLVVALYAE